MAIKVKKDKLVVKSNYLIEASYRLSVSEQKILYMIISMINKNDTDFKDYEFKVNDFIKAIGLKGQSSYSELKNTIRTLRSRTFTIKYNNDNRSKELITGWIVSAEYEEGNLKFNVDPKLKPFLLQLQSHFTAISLSNLMQLRSSYSSRIYELLKQYKNIGERVFKVDDLKNLLAIEENEYKLYAHFKSRVIIPTQEELKEKTDISFDFIEIKEGRKVAAIKFIIKSNIEENSEIAATLEFDGADADIATEEIVTRSKDRIEILKTIQDDIEEDTYKALLKATRAILEEEITESGAKILLNAANNDIELIKEKYEIAKKQKKPINDIVPWLRKAIEEDFKPPVARKTKSAGDSSKRKYDVDELEKMLLGRGREEEKAQ